MISNAIQIHTQKYHNKMRIAICILSQTADSIVHFIYLIHCYQTAQTGIEKKLPINNISKSTNNQ